MLEQGPISDVHPSLPEYGTRGKATSGTLVVRGDEAYLVSGRGPGLALAELDYYAVQTHVEMHAAAIMNEGGIMDADLYINYPSGSCSGGAGCADFLPGTLPLGAELRVHSPSGTAIFKGV